MSSPLRFVVASLVTVTLAVPGLASAQAVPRGSGSSSGSSGSSGSDSGSSGSSGGGESYSPPQRRPSSEGSRTGSAVSRRPSGNPSPSGSSPSSVSSPGERRNPGVIERAGSRDRENQPVTGVAVPRRGVYVDPDDRRRSAGYPWYTSGFGLYYGSYSPYYSRYSYPFYSPYGYASRWGRYGSWYDPFGPFDYYGPFYDPYMYGGYGAGYGYGSGYGGGSYPSSGRVTEQVVTGSVRLRVSPREGQVYLDGTLMGLVDEFDGLTDHLVAPAGQHEIEVRAPGHQPKKWIVDVPADKTVTVRGSLEE